VRFRGVARDRNPSADAWVRIDSYCILRAFVPSQTTVPNYWVSGAVDCGSNLAYQLAIQVCSNVYNAGNNAWYFTGSCTPVEYSQLWQSYFSAGLSENGVCGHVYRSWDQGWDYEYGWDTNTYASGSWTDCSV
jgi:hypothetical protein